MSAPIRPLHEVTEHAITVLAREIGLADTVRFVNQFSSGYGDYTEERTTIFANLALEEILAEITRARAGEQAA
jgi:hypothetical protein